MQANIKAHGFELTLANQLYCVDQHVDIFKDIQTLLVMCKLN